jgi:hypothetical protein
MNIYRQRFKTVAERFWEKVDVEGVSECWNWKASTTRGGYGQFWLGGTQVKAHRVAWELTNGPIPEGMYCLHQCDNPRCCNPNHIRLGSLAENMQECVERDRIAKGERQASAKLTAKKVKEIRKKYARGISTIKLSAEYGVGATAIYEAVRRETWKHVA